MKFLWRSLEEQQKRRKFAGLVLGEEAIRYGLGGGVGFVQWSRRWECTSSSVDNSV